MIKNVISVLAVLWGTATLVGQTPALAPQTYPGQTYPAQAYPPQSYPNQAYPYRGYQNQNTNQFGAGQPAFSNGAGQTFTPAQLAAQLQNLRSVIDQTVPILSAFNQQYSNSLTGSQQGIRGELSGIVSDVFHRNQPAGQNYAVGNAFSSTNLLAALSSLLNRNSTGATGANPADAQDLITLQNDLQPVESILQQLNVTPSPVQQNAPYGQPYPGTYPTPTGR